MKFKHIDFVVNLYNKLTSNLGLQNWTIKVIIEAGEGDTLATNDVNHFDKIMEVSFNKCCNTKPLKEIKNIAIHELIHGLYQYHKLTAKSSESAEAYYHQEEMFINHITKIIERYEK